MGKRKFEVIRPAGVAGEDQRTQAAAGYAAGIFRKQEAFAVRRSDYPNIGTDPARLVVYFSRMGYVKRQAFEEANRTGAAVYEIRSTERIS